MDRETAYRVAAGLTAGQPHIWVPVPMDYFGPRADNEWCVLNALSPEPITVPDMHMWATVRRAERRKP